MTSHWAFWGKKKVTKHLFDPHSIPHIGRGNGEAAIRALTESHYLGDHEVLCRCLGRYKMFLDTRDVGFAPHLIMDGFWEYWITEYMAATVTAGMTAIDVGANFGYYSLLLSDLVSPSGKLLAIEPNPSVASKLRKSLAINGFSHSSVIEACLGRDADSAYNFYVPFEEPKNARIVAADYRDDAYGKCIPVEGTTLDAMTSNLSKVDFIKVDTEGAEFDMLGGMTRTLDKFHPILVIEVNAGRDYDIGELYATLNRFYPSIGFIDYDCRRKPVTLDELRTKNVGHDWMLACVPS